jgi:alkanesulfonate monooxygenase SsuD/methylene tetrahydromethanopterin reductase-like flavin-dependent oxidoreductase (luciferase family)
MTIMTPSSAVQLDPGRPLARGSVSLRIYPLDLPPGAIVADVQEQARLAEEAGFDGCMVAEHHGGFPNYLPNPLLAATWILEATQRMWAAPCPLLLPLRPVTQVVEDLAWTHHRFPGRLGVGVGAGSFPVDFEMAGVPLDELFPRYRKALATLTDSLGGRATGSLAGDLAVAALGGDEIPVVAGVQTVHTTRRAARLGMGVLYNSLQTEEAVREQNEAYEQDGGAGARILIRRLWIGPPPSSNMDAQMARYRDAAGKHQATAGIVDRWSQDDGLIAAPDGAEAAERLYDAMVRSGCDALNIRVFLAGLSPVQVHEQIARHGAETVPRLRALFAGQER